MRNRELPRAGRRSSAASPAILVVEDNRPNRILIDALLDGLGCAAHLVGNGTAALEAAARDAFDLILMDIRMPRMDGIETLRRLRAGGGPNAATAVVALTADADPAEHRRFLEAGMSTVLVKPISATCLAAAIRRWAGAGVSPEPPAA